jgi:hypothetical protein
MPAVADIPVVEDRPLVEDVPVVVHGTVLKVLVEGAVNVEDMVSGGLRPPAPSSVAPIGTPRRPLDAKPIPEGEEADAAGFPPAVVVGHRPDAVPVKPPPSKTAVDVPVPDDVPVMDVLVAVPVLEVLALEVPIVELPVPTDVGGMPPMPPHRMAEEVAVPGVDPVAAGLTPVVPIPVAPSGMFVGGTGAPRPMPSGDVNPMDGVPVAVPPTCARAEPQPKRNAAVVTIEKRVIIVRPSLPGCSCRPVPTDEYKGVSAEAGAHRAVHARLRR